jgi:hypothetical protein
MGDNRLGLETGMSLVKSALGQVRKVMEAPTCGSRSGALILGNTDSGLIRLCHRDRYHSSYLRERGPEVAMEPEYV